MKYLCTILILGLLSGCSGWSTVYGTQNNDVTAESKLSQIEVKLIQSINGQNLYNALLDRLEKFSPTNNKDYILTYNIATNSKSQTSFTDGSASLTLKRYTVKYTLTHLGKKQNFVSTTATSLSTDNSPYNNAELTKKADEQAMNVLANAMITRLAVFTSQSPNW